MTSTRSGTARLRSLWLAIAVVVAISGAAVVLWTKTNSDSGTDCAVVEDIARQWNTTSASITDILLNGAGQPADYRTIADRQTEMAEKLRGAADSVASPDIKEQLNDWADGATDYAALQRGVAERAPGTPVPSQSDTDFERVAKSMIDAAGELGKICPGMPVDCPVTADECDV